ncbi:sensor histidine kinase [Floridanema evergladense]|uniref:histidine kinase n=1 Tax=Floridaenema evergladense BLCC-F167 TaxID=3153639 RepID=A0ABV4WPF1_9CYAN
MRKWLLPTLSEILAETTEKSALDVVLPNDGTKTQTEQSSTSQTALQHLKAEREWFGAIAALEKLLHSIWVFDESSFDKDGASSLTQGLILTGPLPIFSDPTLSHYFPTWVFSTQLGKPWAWMPFQLPPAKENQTENSDRSNSLPLLPNDPLAEENFCLVFTTSFSLVMVLGDDRQGKPAFLFSFDPEVVQQAWDSLRLRMLLTCPHQINQLDTLVHRFAPIAPDYRTVMQFSRLLLKNLPQLEEQEHHESAKAKIKNVNPDSLVNSKAKIQNLNSHEVELLQAFAHEVKTPLATIRTFTRLLLKRKDLTQDIIKKLEAIDHECTEQIERMELLFQAAEMETCDAGEAPVYLTTTSLSQVFQESIPRWQKQALRRSQTLDVVLPQQMPPVVSDPTMLERILSSLIDNFTRSLPAGSHIQVQVMPAGNQLKLQLLTQTKDSDSNGEGKCSGNHHSKRKLIGQLLTFQPETGSLSLSHNVTKSLFQALGGKLIVRERPQQGEVFTIFLPTGESPVK